MRRKLLLLCCLFVFALSSAGLAADITTTVPPQTVTMRLEQYNRLKQITSQYEMTLEALQIKLNLLKQTSTQDKATLVQLQEDLTSCKAELTQTQQSLTSARESLTLAEFNLTKQSESLLMLTEKINSMNDEQKRLKRQRNTWAVIAGVAVLWIACK